MNKNTYYIALLTTITGLIILVLVQSLWLIRFTGFLLIRRLFLTSTLEIFGADITTHGPRHGGTRQGTAKYIHNRSVVTFCFKN